MRCTLALGPILLLALLAAAALARPHVQSRDEKRAATLERAEASRPAFHATCLAIAEGRDRARTERTLAAVLDAVGSASLALDRSDPGSELSLLDARAAESRVPCSSVLWGALAAGLAAARESDGAYDPTDLPLTRAWGGAATARPEPAALSEARSLIGWRQLQLEPGARAVRFPRAGMGLDLDGVGAGAALDQAVDSLRASGIRRARLTIGLVTAVFADEGEPWSLGVEDPYDPGRASSTSSPARAPSPPPPPARGASIRAPASRGSGAHR